jgi:hypothetical protein
METVQRNGEGPFRLGGPAEAAEEASCRLPLYPPPGEGATLPLYPPPGDSTLGKVNIVIFSGRSCVYNSPPSLIQFYTSFCMLCPLFFQL